MRGDYQRAPQLTLLYNAMRAPLLRPCFGLGHTLHCAHNQGSGVVLVGCFLQWPFLHGSRRARWRSCPRSDMSLPSPRPLRAFPATAASLHKCTRCKGLQAPVSLPVHSHGLAAIGLQPWASPLPDANLIAAASNAFSREAMHTSRKVSAYCGSTADGLLCCLRQPQQGLLLPVQTLWRPSPRGPQECSTTRQASERNPASSVPSRRPHAQPSE